MPTDHLGKLLDEGPPHLNREHSLSIMSVDGSRRETIITHCLPLFPSFGRQVYHVALGWMESTSFRRVPKQHHPRLGAIAIQRLCRAAYNWRIDLPGMRKEGMTMRIRSQQSLGGLIALMLAILPTLGSAQESPGWQFEGNSYESPQFGYLVEWNEEWAALERDATSDQGGLDEMTLSNNDGRVRFAGQGNELTASEFLDETIELFTQSADSVEIIAEDREGEIPSVELTADLDHILLEVQTFEDAVVVVSLVAREIDYETALTTAQGGITLNGSPVLSGEAAGPTEAPEADPTEEATEEPGGDSGIDGNTYTSPDHGFTVTWDEDEWEATGGTSEGGFNELRLSSEQGALSILSGNFYGGDAEACLQGEDDYYSNDDPQVSDWQTAVDADGEPISGGGDGVAYSVFTLTFGDDAIELVDYIECRTLEPGLSTMEIFATTTPDMYEDHIAAVLDITNAIAMPEGTDPLEPIELAEPDFDTGAIQDEPTPDAAPDPTEEPTAEATEESTEEATAEAPEGPGGQPGLTGNTFESPSFGFTLEVPADWTVEDDTVTDGDEMLVLTNGLSIVSVHATDAYTGNLPGCIGFARDLLVEDPAFADIRLDSTSAGEPFQGADDRSAYALFTYTGADGEKWAHFVHCQYIVEGESVLIISQDVPYEDYASERGARRQIQNAIEFP